MNLDILNSEVTVIVDRPFGSKHPKFDMIYPINYGYVEGIIAGDGDFQDAYIYGIDYPISTITGIVICVINRNDDVENKWVVVPKGISYTNQKIIEAVYFTEQYFDSKYIFRSNNFG